MCAAAACFPDPPPDEGILLDSGISLSDGTLVQSDSQVASALTLSATTLDFGLAECGGVAPPTQTLTLTNTSSSTVSYVLAASGPEFAIASPPSGQLVAGASVAVVVSSTGVSAFAQAGGVIEGALQIVTDAPGQKLFVVDLKKTAAGAQLVLIPNMSSSVANFGAVAGGDIAALDIGFRNNGNEPITITFNDAVSSPFTLDVANDAGTGFTVAANSTKTLHATYTSDGESSPTDIIGFSTTGVSCGGGDPPASVILQGSARPPGTPEITPGVLSFDVGGTGFVPCGQTAKPQMVTVANPLATDTAFITGTTVTGPFSVTPFIDVSDAGAGIAIAAGSSQSLTVTPMAVTAPVPTSPDGVLGTLAISINGGQPFTLNLSQTAQGAVLAFAPPSLTFGAVTLDTVSQQILGLQNTGNAAVGITLAVAGSPYFSVSPSSQFSLNTPQGSSTVSFLPLAAGAAQGTISLQASGPVCQFPSPATVTLSGNGTQPVDAGVDAGGSDSGLITDAGSTGSDGGLIDSGGGISVDAAIK